MKIDDIVGEISTTKKNKILQLQVRELDKENKGVYVSFVDDLDSSFDVSITIKNEELKNHSCDCNSKDLICLHKLAVLLKIVGSETVTSSVKKTRAKKTVKKTESQVILEELSLNELKGWLQDFFNANKEVESHFLYHFSKQNTVFYVDDLEPLIRKTFVSVVGKRKKIELNELKKIILFLEQSLEPVFKYIQMMITDFNAFLLLEEIIFNLQNKFFHYTIPGTRLQKFEAQLITKFSLMLNNIKEPEIWENSVNLLLTKLFDMEFGKTRFLLIECVFEINKKGLQNQKQFIANQISIRLQNFVLNNGKFYLEVDLKLLQILIDNKCLKSCYAYFTPKIYENEFNLLLLNALKEIDSSLTLDYCFDIIQKNSKVDYNRPYLKIAQEILQDGYDDLNLLAMVKHDLFLLDPNFEDYLFIVNNLESKETVSKFRNNTLSRLRNLFHDSEEYMELYFKILGNEANYKKMLEVIKASPMPVHVLQPYFENLIALNKTVVLNNFCHNLFINLIYDDEIYYGEELYQFANTYFDKLELHKSLLEFLENSFVYYPDEIKKKFLDFFN